MNRRRVAAVAVACGLAVAACGGDDDVRGTGTTSGTEQTLPAVEGLPPTTETLAGVWDNDGGPTPGENALLLRFGTDGTMAFDNGGRLDTDPAVVGTYRLHGDTIVFTADPRSVACDEGDSWTFQAGVRGDGRLHTVVIEDGTGNCSVGIGTEWTWTRV